MRVDAEEFLVGVLEQVARDVRDRQGEESRGALLQSMVAEVQARTGTTVPQSLVEAWLDAVDHAGDGNAEAHDPWDAVDAWLDARRVV